MSSAGIGAMTTLVGGSPSGQAANHVNTDTRFTLVLGGGGMKGVAHVGVLQALTERGLVPAQIVGSSVGALVGAGWSAGKSIAELREIAVHLHRKDVFVDRKSTRLNSSHGSISYAVFCLKKTTRNA